MHNNGDKFTVYDAMEAAGAFRVNPANIGAKSKEGRDLYVGPVKFPMMVYHPRGEEFISVQGQMERTAYGSVEKFNEQWEIVNKVVENEEELEGALSEGWHRYPAMAIKAANETWRKEQGLKLLPVPAVSTAGRIGDLESEVKRLTALLEEDKRAKAELSSSDSKYVSATKGAAARAGLA